MSDVEGTIKVELDYDTEDVIIHCVAADCESTQRFRILVGWLLLYLLDPEGFEDAPIIVAFYEHWLANDPPVGMIRTNEIVLLDLPGGSLRFPVNKIDELRTSLAARLIEFTESIGPVEL